LQANVVH